jgi:hypothetical protein
MWQVYAGVGKSIAIRSNLQRLQSSLSNDPRRVFIGKVKYIDYRTDSIGLGNLFNPYLRKRRSFEHESEVRLVLWSFQKGDDEFGGFASDENGHLLTPYGHAVHVDLKQMIEAVFISPKAKPWFSEVAQDVLCKYGYERIS